MTQESETNPALEDDLPILTTPKKEGVHGGLVASILVLVVLVGALGALMATRGKNHSIHLDAGTISAAGWVGVADSGIPDDAEVAQEVPSAFYGNEEPPLEDAEAPAPPVESAPTPPPEGLTVKHGEVRSGVPVIKNLTALGISAGDAQQMINALNGIFDFRRAQPGQKFELHLDQTGTPTFLKYTASRVDVYEVHKNGPLYTGTKVVVPTQKKLRHFGGTITSSLYGALAAQKAHPSLPGKIADILSTQVNFFKAQRPGDTFRVLVEEESLDGAFLSYGPVLALEYMGTKSGKKRLFYFEAGNGDPTYYDEKGVSVPRSAILIPLHYSRMSSPFGYRIHPVLKTRKLHNGTDFAASTGSPIWACADGVISMAHPKGANGNLVAIDHGDGLSSYYAHLSRFGPGIKQGVKVRQRQVIGYVGSTGRSTGPHLHWGLKKNGKFIDPLKYKIRPGKPVPGAYTQQLKEITKERSQLLNRTKIAPPDKPIDGTDIPDDEVLGQEEDF